MRKELTASKSFTYGTRRLRAGDDFEAGENDARILTAIGKARYRTRVMTPEVSYATKEVTARKPTREPAEAPKAQPEAQSSTFVPPIRQFKRRDA